MLHNLKIESQYYDDVASGIKKAEVRYNDRDYKVGDMLALYDFDGEKLTGRCLLVEVTHICDYPLGLRDGFLVLSFKIV